MNIVIKKLSPNLLKDFLFFFDNIAFADHKDWSGCYCVEPHLCQAAESELPKGIESNCRQIAIEFINSGKLKGYLAYCDNEVVGWVNANDKNNYEKLQAQKELLTDEDNKKIKSIMCFIVAPKHRRKGIASQLLMQICDDSKSENYDFIEVYPYRGVSEEFHYFCGPIEMYKKNEFQIYKDLNDKFIMRKCL